MIKADKGNHLKRLDIKGRGRMGLIHKYRAHLTVVVQQVEDIFKGVPPERRMVVAVDKGPKQHKVSPNPGFRANREPLRAF